MTIDILQTTTIAIMAIWIGVHGSLIRELQEEIKRLKQRLEGKM